MLMVNYLFSVIGNGCQSFFIYFFRQRHAFWFPVFMLSYANLPLALVMFILTDAKHESISEYCPICIAYIFHVRDKSYT